MRVSSCRSRRECQWPVVAGSHTRTLCPALPVGPHADAVAVLARRAFEGIFGATCVISHVAITSPRRLATSRAFANVLARKWVAVTPEDNFAKPGVSG
jgi:hypothetical protein